ncbi:MAG: hypothetical protein ACLFMU_03750 [Bacteroidales bacterium]
MKKIAVGWLLVPMGHGWGKMPAFRRRARRLLIVGYCLDPEGITYY